MSGAGGGSARSVAQQLEDARVLLHQRLEETLSSRVAAIVPRVREMLGEGLISIWLHGFAIGHDQPVAIVVETRTDELTVSALRSALEPLGVDVHLFSADEWGAYQNVAGSMPYGASRRGTRLFQRHT